MITLNGFDVSSKSDIGLIRQGNEDNFYVPTPEHDLKGKGVLLGVADGMGGHNAGEVASQLAVETLGSYYHVETNGKTPRQMLVDSIKKANERIVHVSCSNLDMQGLGTTLTGLVAFEREVIVGHVGDSRVYLMRKGKLEQLTLDHSLVQEAVREGILTPEQARVHPQRNIITRALGTREDLEVDSLVMPVEPGDIFLLASDGLHGLLEDFELEEIMKNNKDLDDLNEALIQAALDQGGSDNVTVVLLRYPEDSPNAAEESPPATPGAATEEPKA